MERHWVPYLNSYLHCSLYIIYMTQFCNSNLYKVGSVLCWMHSQPMAKKRMIFMKLPTIPTWGIIIPFFWGCLMSHIQIRFIWRFLLCLCPSCISRADMDQPSTCSGGISGQIVHRAGGFLAELAWFVTLLSVKCTIVLLYIKKKKNVSIQQYLNFAVSCAKFLVLSHLGEFIKGGTVSHPLAFHRGVAAKVLVLVPGHVPATDRYINLILSAPRKEMRKECPY